MKYLLKYINPILKFIYAFLYFIVGNVLFILTHCVWHFNLPTKTSIFEFNEHYRRRGNNIIYYKTFINYLFDYRGYTKNYT